jgi:hypothetical protein
MVYRGYPALLALLDQSALKAHPAWLCSYLRKMATMVRTVDRARPAPLGRLAPQDRPLCFRASTAKTVTMVYPAHRDHPALPAPLARKAPPV